MLPVLVILMSLFAMQTCKSVIETDEDLEKILRNRGLTLDEAQEAYNYIETNKKVNVVFESGQLCLTIAANFRAWALGQSPADVIPESVIIFNTLIRDLIKLPEFDPNIMYGSLQSTYLHELNILKNESMVQQLLARGANPKICDQNGRNAFHEAIYQGAEEAVEILYEHDKSLLQIKTQEKQPQTPIELAQSTLKKFKGGKKPSLSRIASLQRIEAFLLIQNLITLLTGLQQKLRALATAIGD